MDSSFYPTGHLIANANHTEIKSSYLDIIFLCVNQSLKIYVEIIEKFMYIEKLGDCNNKW